MEERQAPKTRDELKQGEFDAMMQKGLDQARTGQSIPIDEAFSEIEKKLDKEK